MKKHILRHRVLSGGVQEFTFLTNEREAIDVFFDTIGELFESMPKDKTLRYVVDLTQSGMPSLNYMYLKSKEWARKHPHVAPGRGLFLLDERGYLPIARAISMLIMKEWGSTIELRIERSEKRDEGMAWLLATDHVANSEAG